MQMTGNTILITGGGSGIGRGLAEAFHRLGNHVIIAGRRRAALDAVAAANPGITTLALDVGDAESVLAAAAHLKAHTPALNVVIHNAGIMRPEAIASGATQDAEAMITTNLLGPIRLTAALLPQLQAQAAAQGQAAIITVSSGLAFVPLAVTPTYSATKAAIHSWTQSLRHQLRATAIAVLEIAPPYVQTELMGPQQASDPNAMPLDAFITETMARLAAPPTNGEILVERVQRLRTAERGDYHAVFTELNQRF